MNSEITDLANIPAWADMWLLVLALFFTFKSLTLRRLFAPGTTVNGARLLGYLFLWPGMDARAFCLSAPQNGRWQMADGQAGKREIADDRGGIVAKPHVREYLMATGKTCFGAALLWLGVRLINAMHPLIRGWAGMVGVIFLLHFGLFHLLSLVWRAGGVHAQPIMHSPGTVTSLSRFWSGSWNAAFTDLVHEHFFKPAARRFGGRAALVASFLLSGALHELVISVPARGGYGLPTLYFALQSAGLLFERSRLGRRLGLSRGFKGWCFVAFVAGAPAFFLFHPIFVRNVILPMLHAIGAT